MDFSNIIIKNKKIKRLVNVNLLISFIISIIGILLLYIHKNYYITWYLLDISIIIYRSGLFIGTSAIMYGIFFENYLSSL